MSPLELLRTILVVFPVLISQCIKSPPHAAPSQLSLSQLRYFCRLFAAVHGRPGLPVISFCPKQHHHTPVVPMVQFGTYPAAAESAVVSTGPELGPTQPVHNMEGRLGRSPARRHTRASRGAPTTLANTDPTNFQAMLRLFTGDPAGPYANPTGPGTRTFISFCPQQHPHVPVAPMGQFGPYPAAAHYQQYADGPAAIVPGGNVTDGFVQGGFLSSVASNGGISMTTTAMGPAPQGSGDINLVTAMGLLGCLVAFAAGYITTETGQHALKATATARPFPPIDIFVYSVIISLFTLIAAGRFPGFQQCFSAFFIMLASSSVAHFILHHRPFALLVYVPCVVYLMYVVMYNPLSARIHQLFTHIRNRAQLM